MKKELLKELYEAGASLDEISQKTGYARASIHSAAARAGARRPGSQERPVGRQRYAGYDPYEPPWGAASAFKGAQQ